MISKVVFVVSFACCILSAHGLKVQSDFDFDVDSELVEAAERGRMKTINGEKFDIVHEGHAPLLKIPADSGEKIQVMAFMQKNLKCQEYSYITQLNISGSWVGKTITLTVADNIEAPVMLSVGEQVAWWPQLAKNQEKVWSGYEYADWINPENPKDHSVFNQEDGKYSIQEVVPFLFKNPNPGVKLWFSGVATPEPYIEIKCPMSLQNVRPHLDFHMNGLNPPYMSSAAKFTSIGGLLGNDDHSYWTTRDPNCVGFAREPADQDTESTALAQAQ